MGSCPSRFRAQFTLNHDTVSNGTANIRMKPVDEVDDLVAVSDAGVENGTSNGHSAEKKAEAEEKDEEATLSPLIVEYVDVCARENNELHKTSSFAAAQTRLISRRGSPIKFNVVLNRAYNVEEDILCIVLTCKDAKKPSYSQGTQIFLPIVSNDTCLSGEKEWRIEEISSDDNHTTVKIIPAADAAIGEWILEIDTKLKNEPDAADFHYKVKDSFILLFNPWCEHDSVYLNDTERCKEYVLCDSGLIWRGSHNCLRPCIWNYAQYEENILECSLYLLNKLGKLSVVKRADPVFVVRHLSAVLNKVLDGNWSGKYKGGIHPTSWSGSQGILQIFLKTKKAVKFAQCWVFTGVFTTVCRALGIPARPVTNYSSAHDSHSSLTIDLFFDNEGKSVDKLSYDSIWNFHLWTEVWMLRPDLEPGGYGGWQAVDATPQEESDGIYQCGPASVAAIRRGEELKAFDSRLFYTEVNADKVYWKYSGERQPLKLIKKCSDEIGICISTKAVGKFEREDITNEYKHIERSKDEREMMLRALKCCKNGFSRYYMSDDRNDVEFKLCLVDDIIIGDTFTVTLKAMNSKPDTPEYTVNITLRVDSALYTGAIKKLIKRDDFEIRLGPATEQDMTMKLEYKDYERALVEQCAFVITATAHVKESGFDFCEQDDFRVRMPDVSVQVDGDIIQHQPVTVTAFFTNPLPKSLHGGLFVVEGPGFGNPQILKCKGEVKTGADARATGKLIPKSSGLKVIAAKFMSKELNDVDGYHEVSIKPSEKINNAKDNSNL